MKGKGKRKKPLSPQSSILSPCSCELFFPASSSPPQKQRRAISAATHSSTPTKGGKAKGSVRPSVEPVTALFKQALAYLEQKGIICAVPSSEHSAEMSSVWASHGIAAAAWGGSTQKRAEKEEERYELVSKLNLGPFVLDVLGKAGGKGVPAPLIVERLRKRDMRWMHLKEDVLLWILRDWAGEGIVQLTPDKTTWVLGAEQG